MTLFTAALIIDGVVMAQKKRRGLFVIVAIIVIRDTPISSVAAKICGDGAKNGNALAMLLSEHKREEAG